MVQVNDMYYVWAKDLEMAKNGKFSGTLTTVLKFLLEEGIVDIVLAIRRGIDLYDVVPTLMDNPEEIIESTDSLPFDTLNMAKIVEKYLNGAKEMKIAVTCKPCDAMTIVELMKRNRINKDNVIMIGVNCDGTLPPVLTREMIEKIYEMDPDDVIKVEITKGNLTIETEEYEKKKMSIYDLEEQGYGRRSNCRRCEINMPKMADLAFDNWGVIGPRAEKTTFVEVLSECGAEILDKAVKAGVLKVREPMHEGTKKREKIDKEMVNLAKKWQRKYFEERGEGMEILAGYIDEFNKCIKCYGCRGACPLCFCVECSLESESPRWVSKGELPPSPMFHFLRMIHTVDSCTNCGQCEEICPVEIPLTRIYHKINSKLQDVFGYYPGADVEQKPPLSIISTS